MISLKQLLTITPLTDEVRQKALNGLPTMSEDKKFELEQLCWTLVMQWYQMQIRIRTENAMAKQEKGEDAEEVDKIPDKVFSELTQKLDVEETREDLEDVRKKLAQVTNHAT